MMSILHLPQAKNNKVKELPSEGKPFNFTGAVGDFEFTVTPSKTELNQMNQLR